MDKPGIDPVLARQRLLDAADELFYSQGMHRVSIDRVIEKAGVPAETLREAFGSTDELVRAYLRARHTRLQDALARELPRYRTPPERLVGVFEIQGQSFVEPRFRGCALVAASAEARPTDVEALVLALRANTKPGKVPEADPNPKPVRALSDSTIRQIDTVLRIGLDAAAARGARI